MASSLVAALCATSRVLIRRLWCLSASSCATVVSGVRLGCSAVSARPETLGGSGNLVATWPCRRKFLAPQAQRPMLARPRAALMNGAESKVINRLRAKTTDTFLYK